MTANRLDPLIFGQRLRHLRKRRGLTLNQLGGKVAKPAPFLSLLENGRREANLTLINALAAALEVQPSDLLALDPPTRRSELEIELERIQDDALYRALRLPRVRAMSRIPDDYLEHIVTLFRQFKRTSSARIANRDQALEGVRVLREKIRDHDNHFPDIEQAAAKALAAVRYDGRGALPERTLLGLAAYYGFTVRRAADLPASTRSVVDLRNHRIYIPQRDALITRVARSVIVQTLAHFVLRHSEPRDYLEFLQQQLEAKYFAGAVLAPERAALDLLSKAHRDRDISVQDLQELFYISHDMAAHRLTNLATRHFGIPTHLLRTNQDGVIWRAYQNDGIPLPTDDQGIVEGQRVCRSWGARRLFQSGNRFAVQSEYVETPSGTFWSTCRVDDQDEPDQALTVGTRAEFARYFRGGDTSRRVVSRCPDGECCRRPPADLATRWQGMVLTTVHPNSMILATRPPVGGDGPHMVEVYEFLERQAPRGRAASSNGRRGAIYARLTEMGIPRTALTPSDQTMLGHLELGVRRAHEMLYFSVEGLQDDGAPGPETAVRVTAREGADDEPPGEGPPTPLKGVKRTVVQARRAFVGREPREGRYVVVIPLVDYRFRVGALVQLTLEFRSEMKLAEKLEALGDRYDEIVNGVAEAEMPWSDQLLESITPDVLLTTPPGQLAESIASHLAETGESA